MITMENQMFNVYFMSHYRSFTHPKWQLIVMLKCHLSNMLMFHSHCNYHYVWSLLSDTLLQFRYLWRFDDGFIIHSSQYETPLEGGGNSVYPPLFLGGVKSQRGKEPFPRNMGTSPTQTMGFTLSLSGSFWSMI